MEEKRFKVSPDLKEYLENVLKRSNIKYTVNDDETISAEVSGSLFHKFVIRARCEKTDYEKEGLVVTVPHIHVSELDNPHVMKYVSGNAYKVVGTENTKEDIKQEKPVKREIKKFKVAPQLLEFLKVVMTRDNIQYKVNSDNTISAAISGSFFHKLIVRARCEKLDYDKEGDCVTRPHVHISELDNEHVMKRISKEFPGKLVLIVGSKRE